MMVNLGLCSLVKEKLADIDFLLNTEIDIIDIRQMKVSVLEHKAALYNIFKYSLSQFMKKNIKFVTQTKSQLELLFDNRGYPNHIKVERISEPLHNM